MVIRSKSSIFLDLGKIRNPNRNFQFRHTTRSSPRFFHLFRSCAARTYYPHEFPPIQETLNGWQNNHLKGTEEGPCTCTVPLFFVSISYFPDKTPIPLRMNSPVLISGHIHAKFIIISRKNDIQQNSSDSCNRQGC